MASALKLSLKTLCVPSQRCRKPLPFTASPCCVPFVHGKQVDTRYGSTRFRSEVR
eukprot:jgi/Botrbrau1/17196/Bobra.126_1s0001.1